MQESQRRATDKRQGAEGFAFVERAQDERLQILSQSVEGLTGIRFPSDQRQRLFFHSVTVPVPSSAASLNHRSAALTKRGLPKRPA